MSSSVNLVGAAGVTLEAMVVFTLQDCCESSNFACCMLHSRSLQNDVFSFENLPQLFVINVFLYFTLLQLQSGGS